MNSLTNIFLLAQIDKCICYVALLSFPMDYLTITVILLLPRVCVRGLGIISITFHWMFKVYVWIEVIQS